MVTRASGSAIIERIARMAVAMISSRSVKPRVLDLGWDLAIVMISTYYRRLVTQRSDRSSGDKTVCVKTSRVPPESAGLFSGAPLGRKSRRFRSTVLSEVRALLDRD